MLDILIAGGWVMVPIMLCSLIALGIILERFWSLRRSAVAPTELGTEVRSWAMQRRLEPHHLEALRQNSPLGEILASALANRYRTREIIKESVENTGRQVVHRLERFLNTLGTIAGVSPLLGLLGTVFGMIKMFSSIMVHGVGDATKLAGGIGEALITTAAGLCVAIPAFMFYRYFRGQIRAYVVEMEQQAIELIDTIEQKPAAARAVSAPAEASPPATPPPARPRPTAATRSPR